MSAALIVFIILFMCGTGGRSKNPNPKASERPFPLNKNPILKFLFSFRIWFIFLAFTFYIFPDDFEVAFKIFEIWLLLPCVKIFWWMYNL
tara:strand:- start:255 stop:524 length:270 start_codon:yes stop_codon:yes gene_type:complete